ncbi:hypothetical protein [Craterilacuibacter sinensis]|nr:hypothetical protein [Craterilacuibacter sinensis]
MQTPHAIPLTAAKPWRMLLLLIGSLLFACAGKTQAEALTICYHYGCSKSASFFPAADTRDEVAALFKQVASAPEERAAISLAVQRLYREAAQHAPIASDKGGNLADGTADGRMDCVDHSQNDTTFLHYLARQGLLQHHRVADTVWRAPWIIDLHYASRIIETADDSNWVVDSWFFDFGHEPVIVPYQLWKKGYHP